MQELPDERGLGDPVPPATGEPRPDFKRARRVRPKLDLSSLDRLPPHSIEAEQGVLGCVLLSPNEAMGICIETLKAGAESFYDQRHQLIYQTLAEMYDRKEPIDLITLQQRFKDHQQLEGVGGLAYLSSLQDAVPSAANLPYYLQIVREKLVLRRMLTACTSVVTRVHEHQGEVDALQGRELTQVGEVHGRRKDRSPPRRRSASGADAPTATAHTRRPDPVATRTDDERGHAAFARSAAWAGGAVSVRGSGARPAGASRSSSGR